MGSRIPAVSNEKPLLPACCRWGGFLLFEMEANRLDRRLVGRIPLEGPRPQQPGDQQRLCKFAILTRYVPLRAKVKTAGGKWVAEEQLWYVRYGAIAGSQLENYIHIDRSKKRATR